MVFNSPVDFRGKSSAMMGRILAKTVFAAGSDRFRILGEMRKIFRIDKVFPTDVYGCGAKSRLTGGSRAGRDDFFGLGGC